MGKIYNQLSEESYIKGLLDSGLSIRKTIKKFYSKYGKNNKILIKKGRHLDIKVVQRISKRTHKRKTEQNRKRNQHLKTLSEEDEKEIVTLAKNNR